MKHLAATANQLGAMLKVKLGRPAIDHVLGCVHALGRGVNRSVVKVVITYLGSLHRLYRQNGLAFTVKAMKAWSVMLMQSVGGQRLHNLTPLGLRLSRTIAGLPRIIPAIHRMRIRRGDLYIIRLWSTLFGLYRVIEIPGVLKLGTITDPSTMDQLLLPEFSQFCSNHFWPVLRSLFGGVGVLRALRVGAGTFLKELRAKPFLISKSSPAVRKDEDSPKRNFSPLSTSPGGVWLAALIWSQSNLMPFLRDWCQMTGNIWVLNRIETWTNPKSLGMDDQPSIGDNISSIELGPDISWGTLGRLGLKDEPAGKVRVFAMVDPFTQWLLEPLHRAIFSLLRVIPQDGTFDQLKPIRRLMKDRPRGPYYSFDLSAATDRLPLAIQKVLLSRILGSWGAEVWGTLLVGRSYRVADRRIPEKVLDLRYATGQPMGALSSWAMLALVHHAIVQWAALRAGVITKGGWFGDYAVLGDDIVIANKAVARQYEDLMSALGVGIGLHKSLVSPRGLALEFAKRFMTSVGDASQVPFAEFWASRRNLSVILEFARKNQLTLSQMLTVLGYGYKAKGHVTKRLTTLPSRLANYVIAWHSPSGPGFTNLRDFLTLRGVGSHYKVTEAKVSILMKSFFEQEIKALLDKIDKLQPLVTAVKQLVTVHRDREHYGTVKRGPARKTSFQDLYAAFETTYGWNHWVTDSIRETVFREAFLDTIIELRDLRTKLEEIQLDALDWDAFVGLVDTYSDISDRLGAIPLPRDIYARVSEKSAIRTSNQWIELWRKYSSAFRTTKAT